ncbi:hypothetical protein [Kosakonia sp.]|uniref:hypothetical protein n=1 Tax=Kosakonia sp. TaxID=1916651 RepID=UPI0028B172D6|nr:hypothetical protein [Kosakonia sp.]
MLESYFGSSATREQKQRILAMQAALEIAKSSAGASVANSRPDKVEQDLKYAAEQIERLADAIQTGMNK